MKPWSNYVLTALALFTVTIGMAQRPGPGQERIRKLKVAFLTDELALTTEEAQVFWPVYYAHEKAIAEIRREERGIIARNVPELDAMDDAQAERFLDRMLELRDRQGRLGIRYVEDLKEVLPPKKILRLFRAEENFKRRLLQLSRRKERP